MSQVIPIRPELALDDLDSLLAESVDLQLQAKQIKEDRKRLFESQDLSVEDRERLRAEILRWESVAEWLPQQFVAVEQQDTCNTCHSTASHFLGLYQLQHNKLDSTLRRFVLWSPQAVIGDAAKLPRTYHTVEVNKPLCPRCVWEQGFALRYEGDLKP